jgi:hypothetical protein
VIDRRERGLSDVEVLGVVLGVAEASIVSWVVAGAVLVVAQLLRRRSRIIRRRHLFRLRKSAGGTSRPVPH